jgi:hypothetical protein
MKIARREFPHLAAGVSAFLAAFLAALRIRKSASLSVAAGAYPSP